MKVYRIKLTSWTASFRYPNIMSGYQPTLLVPPVSTVLGILNSCAGKYLVYDKLDIGYYFEYGGKISDIETIYQVGLNDRDVPMNQMKSNIIRREILSDAQLYLYLLDSGLVDLFRKPYYPLVMGRSSDLATVEEIKELELFESDASLYIKGQVIPFANYHLPGIIQALPKYFSNTIPRQNLGTEPYSVIPYDAAEYQSNIPTYRDTINGKPVDIYIHRLNFNEENEKND